MASVSRIKFMVIGLLSVGLFLLVNWTGRPPLGLASSADAPARINAGVREVLTRQGDLRAKMEQTLPGLEPGHIYSLSLSIDTPRRFGPADKLVVALHDAGREIARKTLHLGDPDLYLTFRPTVAGAGKLTLEAAGAAPYHYQLKVLQWSSSPGEAVVIESEPNNHWREANPIRLGQTVLGTADDNEYMPPPDTRPQKPTEGGEDWFRFEFTDDKPRLVYFELDLPERDNIPVDVSLYRVENGEAKVYEEGADPVTPPHEVQALPGNKFTTRVLKEKGPYYVRVVANHPAYQLRTGVYDVPPYTDARQAVRTAVDYIISAGDSWHANTPRKGGLYDRVANVHQETSLCVACHATHFSQRAQLYSIQNGYPLRQRPPLQFMAERFYNNPRPFYGHPEATWARVISAPANVLSRMGALLNIYEQEITHEHRDAFFKGVGEYLKLYYRDRTKLPPDESNGNTPLVSTYEVAWYSWVVLDELYRRTSDKTYLETRDRVRGLVEQNEIKNMVDLCYQTLALCTIDRERYRDRIRQNGERILSLQRPSGQWAMNFDPSAPEAEFQTGHCLWTLAVAGYPADDPRIAKAIQYLLQRQQPFGGWFDPGQPYENFRTPFRETQMAVLALSEFFKGPAYRSAQGAPGGWGRGFAAPPPRLDFARVDALLNDLDNIWDPPGRPLASDLLAAAQHADARVRQAAVACLGRVGDAAAVGLLQRALGDPNKMVQRTAAWSLRQLASRKGLGIESIGAALSDPNDRVRWGATRVFATHFSSLARHSELANKLLRLAEDPVVTVRMQALKGLWQWWYWNDDEGLRSRIEDTFIAHLAAPEHPWVRRNLQEGLYNIADENIRYLYNNWVPLLGTPEDRERATRARLAIEARLADKVAHTLKTGNDRQREGVLRGLTEFHLRDANSYETDKPPAKSGGTLYTRIGNDTETVQFFGSSVDVMAQALRPLMDSPSGEMRRLATKASFMLREVGGAPARNAQSVTGLAYVAALAGQPEEGRQLLARAVYRRLTDPDPAVRAVAQEVYKSFTLDAEKHRTDVAGLLDELLKSPYPEARTAALESIRKAGPTLADVTALGEAVKQRLLESDVPAPAALSAVRSFPSLYADPAVIAAVEKALAADDARAMGAALELALQAPKIEQSAKIAPKLERLFAARDSKKRKAVLDVVAGNRAFLADRRVQSLLSDALLDADGSVMSAALNLVRQDRTLQKNPAVMASLAELRNNPKAATLLRGSIDDIYQGKSPSPRGAPASEAGDARLLDYAYFRDKVQPILATRGPDGNACVYCHATHAIFKLNPPGPEGKYSEEQLRENYRSALKVVDLLDPEQSLILRKPTSGTESEGLVGSDRLSHGGGQRWPKGSPEYRTLLEWISGAKSVSAQGPGK